MNLKYTSHRGFDVTIGHIHRSTDLNQAAQLVLSHPSGSGARDVAGDLHFLHGLNVGAEVCEGGSSCWTYVHHHQPVNQTRL